jgi:hypothetical protein
MRLSFATDGNSKLLVPKDVAGYSETPLVRKLGIKASFRVALVKAPLEFARELAVLIKTFLEISTETVNKLWIKHDHVRPSSSRTTAFSVLHSRAAFTENRCLLLSWIKLVLALQ